jgi:hypothetical protein
LMDTTKVTLAALSTCTLRGCGAGGGEAAVSKGCGRMAGGLVCWRVCWRAGSSSGTGCWKRVDSDPPAPRRCAWQQQQQQQQSPGLSSSAHVHARLVGHGHGKPLGVAQLEVARPRARQLQRGQHHRGDRLRGPGLHVRQVDHAVAGLVQLGDLRAGGGAWLGVGAGQGGELCGAREGRRGGGVQGGGGGRTLSMRQAASTRRALPEASPRASPAAQQPGGPAARQPAAAAATAACRLLASPAPAAGRHSRAAFPPWGSPR